MHELIKVFNLDWQQYEEDLAKSATTVTDREKMANLKKFARNWFLLGGDRFVGLLHTIIRNAMRDEKTETPEEKTNQNA